MAVEVEIFVFTGAVAALLHTYVVYPIVLLALAEGHRGAE